MLVKSNFAITRLLVLTLASPTSHSADDAVSIEGGWSEKANEVDRAGVAFQSDRWMPSLPLSDWQLTGYWEISASYWSSHRGLTETTSLGDFGLTPFVRFQPVLPLVFGARPFIEGGVGLHAMTADGIGDADFGTEFAFGTHAGVGLRYDRFDISYRFQHQSNAGLADPNAGIDFHILRLGYHFR